MICVLTIIDNYFMIVTHLMTFFIRYLNAKVKANCFYEYENDDFFVRNSFNPFMPTVPY